MELNVIENKKNRLVFVLKGTDHSICNILKAELWNDEHIKVATYSIKHPLIGSPEFIVETDGEVTPKAAINGAINRLKKTSERFRKIVSEEL